MFRSHSFSSKVRTNIFVDIEGENLNKMARNKSRKGKFIFHLYFYSYYMKHLSTPKSVIFFLRIMYYMKLSE